MKAICTTPDRDLEVRESLHPPNPLQDICSSKWMRVA